jgi:mRNA-degrading endonuclease RelE of RelBE toxin-antitoxin system
MSTEVVGYRTLCRNGLRHVKKLQGIDPPEFRLRVGDVRARFQSKVDILHILRVRKRKTLTAKKRLRIFGIRY